MQIQQNIFLFHKTFLKIPRWFFLAISIIIVGIIGYQTAQAFRLWTVTNTNIQSISTCFFEYHQKTNTHLQCEYLTPQPIIETDKQKNVKVITQTQEKNIKQPKEKNIDTQVEKQHTGQKIVKENEQDQTKQKLVIAQEQAKNKQITQTPENKKQQNQQPKQQDPDKQAKNQQKTQQQVKTQDQEKKRQTLQEHRKGVFQILNDTTVLDIDMRGQRCQIKLNIPEMHNQSSNYFNYHENNAYLVKTNQLLHLPKTSQYKAKHNIVYNSISIPFKHSGQFLIGSNQMTKREILIYSMSQGFSRLEDKIYNQHKQIIQKKQLIQNLRIYVKADFANHSTDIPFKNRHYILLTQILVIIMSLWIIIISSILFGIVVRFSIFSIITLYLVLGGRANFGWYQQYLNVIRGRNFTSIYFKFWLSIGMIVLFTFIAFGSYTIMKHIGYFQMREGLHHAYYCYRFMKTIFFMQLCHYLFMHTRTTIYFYSRITNLISLCMMIFVGMHPYYYTQYIITVYQLIQALITCIMIMIEQQVLKNPFYCEFTPNILKPRMLFYVGYQLSWHQTIPPIWTYFTEWFDWTLISQKQRMLIQGDYQLLYGMILGMNERHPLPQDQENNYEDTELRALRENE